MPSLSKPERLETTPEIVLALRGAAAGRRKKTARGSAAGRGLGEVDYFFALQLGQCAQSVLASAQHFMWQEAAALSAQQAPREAQPVKRVVTPASAAHSTNNLSVFIVVMMFDDPVRRLVCAQ